jgi:hypothetical protein
MDLSTVSVLPQRATSYEHALELVRDFGAAIVPDLDSEEAVIAYGNGMLGEHAAMVRPQFVADKDQQKSYKNIHETILEDEKGRKRSSIATDQEMWVHNDGKTFGDFSPEYILLWCQTPDPTGGYSILVDGLKLLGTLAEDPQYAALVDFCWNVPIDHSEAHHPQPSFSTIARPAPKGGFQVRCHYNLRAVPGPDEAVHQAFIDQWIGFVRQANTEARRFHLEAGEAALVDNYRVMHGRTPFTSPLRRLVSTWVWTDQAIAVPPVGLDFANPEAVLAAH